MRIIKFRAWDKEKGKIVYEIEFNKIPNGINHAIKICDILGLELMQFTGLKDKNKKEIYEGDIVESTDKTARYEIVFLEGSYMARSIKLKDYYDDISMFHKVIGNIYENPELINK